MTGTSAPPPNSTSHPSRRVRGTHATYDAFISYSHQADHAFSQALENALKRFAKPWYRRRALAVFRDKTDLAASPELWSSIKAALDRSEYLILLASPGAAGSVWVKKECEHWLSNRDRQKLILVLTDGTLSWNQALNAFDGSASTALPPALLSAFSEEPNYVDARWARSTSIHSVREARFLDLVANVAAPIHGVPKVDLESAEIKEHRRAIVTAWAAAIVLFALLVATGVLALYSNKQRAIAASRQELAERTLAKSDLARALDLVKENQAGKATAHLARSMLLDPTLLSAATRLSSLMYQRSFAERAALGPPLSEPVRFLEYSSDGRLLAAASDSELAVWNVEAGSALLAFESNFTTTHLEFSRDGKWLVRSSGYGGMGGTHGEVHVWSMDAPERAPTAFRVDGMLWTAKFLADSRTLVTASAFAIERWSAADGQRVGQPLQLEQIAKAVPDIMLTDNSFADVVATQTLGELIVVAGVLQPAVMARVNIDDGETLGVTKLPMTPGPLRSSEDGRHLLLSFPNDYLEMFSIGNTPRMGLAAVYDVATLEQVGVPMASDDLFADVLFLPHGQSVFAGAGDGKLRLWSAPTGAPISVLGQHLDSVTAIDAATHGLILASGSQDGTARLWSALDPSTYSEALVHSSPVTSVRFAPNATHLATGTQTGQVYFWKVSPFGAPRTAFVQENPVDAVSLDSESRRLVTHSEQGLLRLWDFETGAALAQLPAPGEVSLHAPDERTLLIQNANRFKLMQVGDASDIIDWVDLGSEITQISLDRSRHRFLTATEGGKVQVWNARTGAPEGEALQHSAEISSAIFASDGSILAASEHSVFSFDPQTGKTVRNGTTTTEQAHPVLTDGKLTRPVVSIVDLRLLSAGRFLALYGGRGVTLDVERIRGGYFAEQAAIWAQDSLTELTVLDHGRDSLTAVGASTDGRWIALGNRDGDVRVWAASDGAAASKTLHHSYPIRSLTFTAHDERLVVDGKRDQLQIWQGWGPDAQSTVIRVDGQVIKTLVLPEAGSVVTLSTEQKIEVWDDATGAAIIDPLLVPRESNALAVSALGNEIVAVDSSGTAWAWKFSIPQSNEERCNLARLAQDYSRYALNQEDIPTPVEVVTAVSPLMALKCPGQLGAAPASPVAEIVGAPPLRHPSSWAPPSDEVELLLWSAIHNPSDACLRTLLGKRILEKSNDQRAQQLGTFWISQASREQKGLSCPL